MRLAVILERFVTDCLYRSWHDDADLTQGIELGYKLPALESYPQDSDWKSLDHKLASQVLSFRNEIASAETSCHFQAMREGNGVAAADETIIAGVNAWRLALALRKKYQLDVFSIDRVEFLERAYEKIKQQRKEYAERANSNAWFQKPT
jgi:hypothetical protein